MIRFLSEKLQVTQMCVTYIFEDDDDCYDEHGDDGDDDDDG